MLSGLRSNRNFTVNIFVKDSLKEVKGKQLSICDTLLEANIQTELFNLNYLSLLLNLKLLISHKTGRLVFSSH